MIAAEFAAWATGVLAVLGTLGILWRGLRAMVRRLDRIEKLASELEANGGGSIKDTVHRTDTAVCEIRESLAEHEHRIVRNEGRIEAIAMVTSPTVLVDEEVGKHRDTSEATP